MGPTFYIFYHITHKFNTTIGDALISQVIANKTTFQLSISYSAFHTLFGPLSMHTLNKSDVKHLKQSKFWINQQLFHKKRNSATIINDQIK